MMIKEIHSRDNRIYKLCQKLSRKKYRDREGCYLIEGFHLMGEVDPEDLVAVLLREDISPEALPKAAGSSGADRGILYQVAGRLFDGLAQTQTSQGVLAIVKKPDYDLEFLQRCCGDGRNVLVLDRLQDPGNIGTMIRTAEGAGYGAVIAMKGTGDIYAPKTIRAASGSVFRIPVVQVEDSRELMDLVTGLNKQLVVTSPFTDKRYFDVDISRDTALVIGNEGNGVSDVLMELARIKIRIPMEGTLESLNASVAAGILMYEAQRQKTTG